MRIQWQRMIAVVATLGLVAAGISFVYFHDSRELPPDHEGGHSDRSADALPTEPPRATGDLPAGDEATPDAAFQSRPPNRLPTRDFRPSGHTIDFARLSRAALNGDVAAAVALHKGIGRCVGAPRNPADIERIMAVGKLGEPVSDQVRAERRAFLERSRSECSIFTDAQIGSYRHWLGLAAQLGDLESQLRFVDLAAPNDQSSASFAADMADYVARSKGYIDEQLRLGRPEALLSSSQAYSSGLIHRRDPVQAYAYLYAYSLAVPGERGSWVQDLLADAAARLPDSDLMHATEEGTRIWSECCNH